MKPLAVSVSEAATMLTVVDHVIAISRGGTNEMENLVTACADCNLGKADQ